jgi:hypothetical protein
MSVGILSTDSGMKIWIDNREIGLRGIERERG